jgi:hypothetical protein
VSGRTTAHSASAASASLAEFRRTRPVVDVVMIASAASLDRASRRRDRACGTGLRIEAALYKSALRAVSRMIGSRVLRAAGLVR